MTVVLIPLLAGCSLVGPTLDESGVVELKISSRDKSPRIFMVSAYRISGGMEVRGQLGYPIRNWFGMFPGHVDLTIKSPGKKEFTIHDFAVVRKRIPKKRGRTGFFVARVATDTPKGTRVTVEYSDEKHEGRM